MTSKAFTSIKGTVTTAELAIPTYLPASAIFKLLNEKLRVKTSDDQYWSKVCGEIQKSIFTSIISMAL